MSAMQARRRGPRPDSAEDRAAMRAMGEAIRARRKHLGLTQETVAGRAGMSDATISDAELGRHEMGVVQLQKLARALLTTPAVLLAEADERLAGEDAA